MRNLRMVLCFENARSRLAVLTFGKPTTCAGGGDSALAVGTRNRLYFGDLQGLTNVSNSGGSPVRVTAATPSLQTNLFPWIGRAVPHNDDQLRGINLALSS